MSLRHAFIIAACLALVSPVAARAPGAAAQLASLTAPAAARRLSAAAAKDRENVMPYLVDCCHAYATVGEMVSCLKNQWGEFKEPVNL